MKVQLSRYIAVVGLAVASAQGQLDVGSDGSDGALNPLSGTEIDLSLAAANTCGPGGDEQCSWDSPSPEAGQGVYDAEKWAVVFKYTAIDIPSGVTVTFKNHPKGAPVVWLVQGDVTVDGEVNLDGGMGTWYALTPSEPGPGGFRGGRGELSDQSLGSGGYGPGGASSPGQGGGSHGTAGEGTATGRVYGHERVVPLIGGSGGNGSRIGAALLAGGAGGGAILIAANGAIATDGQISADGGPGYVSTGGGTGGSGGAIRLIATDVLGNGSLTALGADSYEDGGAGRISIEVASTYTLEAVSPTPWLGQPDDPVRIWPASDAPTLKVTQLTYTDEYGVDQTIPVPEDPSARLDYPFADLSFLTDQDVTLDIETTNVPLPWTMTVRVVPKSGHTQEISAQYQTGDDLFATWTATFALPGGFSAIQLRGDAP